MQTLPYKLPKLSLNLGTSPLLPPPHHQPLPLTPVPGSYYWGIGFASTGSLMVGSLVADREKGTRHQLQMTGLAHRACVARARAFAALCPAGFALLHLLHLLRLVPRVCSYWIGSLIHDILFQLIMCAAAARPIPPFIRLHPQHFTFIPNISPSSPTFHLHPQHFTPLHVPGPHHFTCGR